MAGGMVKNRARRMDLARLCAKSDPARRKEQSERGGRTPEHAGNLWEKRTWCGEGQ